MNSENDNTALPAGVSIAREFDSLVVYRGSESALLAAGLLRPEWAVGLGRHTRQIAINPSGGFSILGEGKGNWVTHAHRQHGAFSVKRLAEGDIEVGKYRTIAEGRDRKEARREEWERERERSGWNQAKTARAGQDFPSQWKGAVIDQLGIVADLLEGKRVFTGFPEIKLPASDLEETRRAVALLRSAIAATSPRLNDIAKEVASNVICLRGRAYRAMSAA